MMHSQALKYKFVPGMTLEEDQPTNESNSDLLDLYSCSGIFPEIRTGEDLYLINYFEVPSQETDTLNHRFQTRRHDEKLKIVMRDSRQCYEEVNFDKAEPCYNQFEHNAQQIFGVHNNDLSDSTKMAEEQIFLQKLSDGNDGEPHMSRTEYRKFQGSSEKNMTAWDPNVYPIIRRPINIMVTGSKISQDFQSQNQRLLNIRLSIIGDSLQETFRKPWSRHEMLEGRRIVIVEREQHGQTLKAHFRVIQEPMSLRQEEKSDHATYLQVSCIRFDHIDGSKTNYFITSVDVIKIVEFLIVNKHLNSTLKWRERGRIRSNLAPLWFNNWSEFGPMHLPFEKKIPRYHSRSAHKMLKYVRLLLWVNLEHALSKALLFYCVCTPVDSSTHIWAELLAPYCY